MKKLLLLISAFVAGQAITLYKQDPKFQKAIKTQPSFVEKCKIFAHQIFGYNKNLLNEGKEYLESNIDQDQKTEILDKKTEIQTYIGNIKTAIQEKDHIKIDILIAQAKAYIDTTKESMETMKEKIVKEYATLSKEYHIQEHLDELHEYIQPYLQSEKKTISSPHTKKKTI